MTFILTVLYLPSPFFVDIPESAQDSFYSGKPYVTLKDKVIQSSSHLRHAAEQNSTSTCDQVLHNRQVDSKISIHKLKKEDLKKNVALHDLMKLHTHRTPYVFQIKKCMDADSSYCAQHPIQLEPDQFTTLHYLPLPLLDGTKMSYLAFENLYGKEPSDPDRPSSVPTSNSEVTEEDTHHKAILKKGIAKHTYDTRGHTL